MKKQIIIGIVVFLAMVMAVLANPVINPITDRNVNENQVLTVDVVTSAPNSGSTTFQLTPALSWATITKVDDTHATVTLSPGYDVVATGASQIFDFTVTAMDTDSTSTDVFSVTVNNINRNPTITAGEVTVGPYEESTDYDVSASDPDGDTLIYSITSGCDSSIATCTISSSGELDVERETDDNGATTCTVQVSDGKGGVASAVFDIEVEEILMLKVEEVEVKGDCDEETFDEDEALGTMEIKDVMPGGELEIEIKLENLFDDNDDIEIQNIEVEGTIFDVDTGDDEDDIDTDTVELDEIKPEDSETISIVFEIPLIVQEDTYSMEVTIDAEDEDDNNIDITLYFDVEIKKDNHLVVVKDASASPSFVKAGGKTTIEVEIVNVGTNNEDEAKIVLDCDELGITASESNIYLDEDIDDDDNVYTHDFEVVIPADADAGDYTCEINAYHDNRNMDDTEFVTITVEAAEEEEEEEDIEVKQITEKEQEMIDQEAEEADITQTTEGESFTESTLFIILLIVGIVVVIILIILLLLLAFRR